VRALRQPPPILGNTIKQYLRTRFVDSYVIGGTPYIDGMHRWRISIIGKPSGRPIGSVMAPDEVSAREKALDFYQIEPTLLQVAPIKLSSAAAKPRDHLVSRWQR